MIKEVIHNRNYENYDIFKYVLLFGFVMFIAGVILGYIINNHIVYNQLYDLLNNTQYNGVLLFDGKYYKFYEVP